MKQKYRIPTINEFVIGFEYELDCEMVQTTVEQMEDKDPWVSCVVNKDTDLELIEEYSLKYNFICVKI